MSTLNANNIKRLDGANNFPPVGSQMFWLDDSPPDGYLYCDGSTIGSAASGAGHADDQMWFLFKELWERTTLAILTSAGGASTRGADAATDFAANKRMTLPNPSGLVPRFVGSQAINGRTKTGPSAFAELQEDQFQGHSHPYVSSITAGNGSNIARGANADSNRAVANADETTYGPVRVGNETQASSFGMFLMIRC